MAKGVVLVADDDASVRMVICQALQRDGFDARPTSNFSTLWQWIEEGVGDCVISDVIMPDGEAFDILPKIRQLRPRLPVMLISAQNTFMTAMKAQEAGAFEYFPKPFDLNAVLDAVKRCVLEPTPIGSAVNLQTLSREMPLVGRSPVMQDIYRKIARLRLSTLPLLLTGENGVGKSHIARVIHEFSELSEGEFRAINLAGKREEAIEEELFGRYAVAESDAGQQGTLFLNEIAELPLPMQARLLRRLLESESVADTNQLPRLICAASEDLHLAIQSGRLREDLFYRLSTLPINIPPLRERLEDIPDLVRHFLRQAAMNGAPERHMAPEAMQRLKDHLWPGNVIELENVVKRLSLLSSSETISLRAVEEQVFAGSTGGFADTPSEKTGFQDLQQATAHFVQRFFETDGRDANEGIYGHFLEQFEQPLISAALKATNGNQIKAARVLGLNRNTLRKKIQQYGIQIVKTVK